MSAQTSGMLTACAWVPNGAMRTIPIKMSSRPDLEPEEDYDDEDNWEDADDSDEDQMPSGGKKRKERTAKSDAHDSKTNPGAVFDQGQNVLDQIGSDDEDEAEDTVIRDSDLVLITSRANEETPSLELYIYDETQNHIYLHHDVPLSAFPLCTTWFTDGTASMALVGTMHPFAEVWNLDTIDAVEPIGVLGGCQDPLDNYKRKVRRTNLKDESHTDAVISLDWNCIQHNMVLSGSADTTCKLWDLSTTQCMHTAPHKEKVQCVKWNPREASQLLTATFDGTVTLFDVRNNDDAATIQLESGIEKAQFCYQTQKVFVSTSSGHFGAYDLRKLGQPLFVVKTNDENTTFAINRHKTNLCATGGKDGRIALWDMGQMVSGEKNAKINEGGAMPAGKSSGSTDLQPQILVQNKLGVGELFGMDFHPNKPYYLTACGATGKPLVYDTQIDANGDGRFGE